ncbi:acidic leucine-rich nuclear phosphoprotein 32 family member B-like [Quillaja saponaria]|uniref:Acidic leucine-rich nuclear phosphoprotein 32 family member B-like n=1 Tax=Quillaja saponaria TaxID=32244 RepID=A0AAD7KPI8_QUISA|nr:acidic leucine-rich nuclear phosphoprotein 32 family member B-like [Quillaja saponaria]
MESCKVPGGAGECSGGESGWTTYIGSPFNQENSNDDDDDEKSVDIHENDDDNDDDEETDDSMASDASSGPSHQGSHGMDYLKNADDDRKKFSPGKRNPKHVKKTGVESRVEVEKKKKKKKIYFLKQIVLAVMFKKINKCKIRTA